MRKNFKVTLDLLQRHEVLVQSKNIDDVIDDVMTSSWVSTISSEQERVHNIIKIEEVAE